MTIPLLPLSGGMGQQHQLRHGSLAREHAGWIRLSLARPHGDEEPRSASVSFVVAKVLRMAKQTSGRGVVGRDDDAVIPNRHPARRDGGAPNQPLLSGNQSREACR